MVQDLAPVIKTGKVRGCKEGGVTRSPNMFAGATTSAKSETLGNCSGILRNTDKVLKNGAEFVNLPAPNEELERYRWNPLGIGQVGGRRAGRLAGRLEQSAKMSG